MAWWGVRSTECRIVCCCFDDAEGVFSSMNEDFGGDAGMPWRNGAEMTRAGAPSCRDWCCLKTLENQLDAATRHHVTNTTLKWRDAKKTWLFVVGQQCDQDARTIAVRFNLIRKLHPNYFLPPDTPISTAEMSAVVKRYDFTKKIMSFRYVLRNISQFCSHFLPCIYFS